MQKIAKAISANDLFKEMRQKHIELKNKFEKSDGLCINCEKYPGHNDTFLCNNCLEEREKLLSQLRGPGFMEINIKCLGYMMYSPNYFFLLRIAKI